MNHNDPRIKDSMELSKSLEELLEGKDSRVCITALTFHLMGIYKESEIKKEDFMRIMLALWDKR